MHFNCIHNHTPSCLAFSLRPWRAAVIIHTRLSGIICKAIIVKVNLGTALLQHLDDIVERAKAVCVLGTSRVGIVQRDNGVVAIRTD